MSSPPRGSSLHTLEDSHQNEQEEPLLHNEEIPPPALPDPYYDIPRQADYERPLINPYFIQQSYADRFNATIYKENQNNCFSMSRVRRMFCLLSLFDCLMTFLMWVIYLQLSNGGIKQNLTPQVTKLDIHSSLFDIVLCAIGRTFFLLLFYSIVIKSTKWYFVAITTSASTIFLLMKVFLLDKKSYDNGQPMNFFLIIFSFIITWCEAWHFDFKVVPQESQTNNLSDLRTGSLPTVAGDFLGSQRSRQRAPRGAPSSFYTPYGGSVYQGGIGAKSHISEESYDSEGSDLSTELRSVFNEEDVALVRKANDLVHMVFRMLYINDGWTLNREEKDNITVSSRNFDGVGKVFKIEAVIDVTSSLLNQVFWINIDSQPSWNASVKECKILRQVNKFTDIIYSVAAEAGGGVISSRDFVSLRRRKRKGPLTLLCNVSIESPLMPSNASFVRGYNGPGGWILRDIPGEPNKTEFIWLLNTKLGGWLPQKLVETSLAGVMVDTIRDIRKHVSTLPPS